MKTSAILLAGAVAFDLGTMVVPSHAASDMYMKIHKTSQLPTEQVQFNFIKIDMTNTASVCATKGGKVVPHEGVQQCQLPNNPATGNK